MPGELHLGEVDEFEAAIVSGAEEAEADRAARRRGPSDADDAFVADEEDRQDERQRSRTTTTRTSTPTRGGGGRRHAGRAPRCRPGGAPGAATKRGPARFIGFLRASWAELQRVQWPDRRQVAQATAVVIGFVVVAGLYLGVADWVAKKIVDFII